MIYQARVFSGIDNSCGAVHAIWSTDPVCYYLSQTGKAPANLAEAMGYIAEQDYFVA